MPEEKVKKTRSKKPDFVKKTEEEVQVVNPVVEELPHVQPDYQALYEAEKAQHEETKKALEVEKEFANSLNARVEFFESRYKILSKSWIVKLLKKYYHIID